MNIINFKINYPNTYSLYSKSIYSKMMGLKPIERIYSFVESREGVKMNFVPVFNNYYKPRLSINEISINCGEGYSKTEAKKIVVDKALAYLEFKIIS
ncbi:hypothetical protein [Sphingobacterium kyonggiense]